MEQTTQLQTPDSRWNRLYKLGGVAAIVIAVLLIGEIVVYATIPSPITVPEHFDLFIQDPLVGLLNFDLLGMIAYIFFVPTILAIYVALRRDSEAWMAVATVLFFVGIADFFATNTGFPMLSLSNQYALATTDAEREMLLAAGKAMITLFDESAFLVSYVIVSASWVIMSAVMFRSSVFSRFTGLMGMLAGIAGIVAVVLEHITFVDALMIAIALYFAAIVFLFLWVLLAGRQLYKLPGTHGPAIE